MRLFLWAWAFFASAVTFAAKPIDLRHQPAAFLQSFQQTDSSFKTVSTAEDFNHTQHIRMQQYFKDHLVWGADFVKHTRHPETTTLNGIVYQGLAQDLQNTPAYVFQPAQADKALQAALQLQQEKIGRYQEISQHQTELMVYVDKTHQAHWAFWVKLYLKSLQGLPLQPIYLLDAVSFQVYRNWNNIQTSEVPGGGWGGNLKIGKITYDGKAPDYPALDISRNHTTQVCTLQNSEVTVKDVRHDDAIMHFKCKTPNRKYNNVYWNADHDAVNGGYSPSHDALFVGKTVKNLYQQWYGIPVLTDKDKPMMLTMRVHDDMDNAYWDGEQMTFGDGISEFYPLVSLGVGAHEISHGFTQQHAGLVYDSQSGGLNESFSDMAACAAEFFVTKKNTWQIGSEIEKAKDKALRYMDEPTKDCGANKPGQDCSISKMSDYNDSLDVHYSSGIFNKVFYLLSTTKGWDTQKAFNLMVQANQHYWTSTTNFTNAACDVLLAAKDYHYSEQAVMQAMQEVGISLKTC